jgi:hypothetical protein
MQEKNERKAQKRQTSYDRAYRRTSIFLASLAAPIIGRKLKDDKKRK